MKSMIKGYHTRVTSEPGDGTRYDYAVIKDGPDEYCVVGIRSTFKFPSRVNKYAAAIVNNIGDIPADMIEFYDCNPYTLLEVCRTINELESEDHKEVVSL